MNKIIAAVSSEDKFSKGLKAKTDTIFYLIPNIVTLEEKINAVHKAGKTIYIHMDMAEGIAKDKFGIEYVSNLGVDGIISTRANIIKMAKKCGLKTVQRFFIIDAHSVDTTVETANASQPDMIEIMPGIAAKIINKIKSMTAVPIIAGGLIETVDEVNEAISIGAVAISTSNHLLWEL